MFAGCAGHDEPPRWHVDGNFLRAPDGRAQILRGVNLSGAQKAPPYLDDKREPDYARIRQAWGMNAIRFIMTWSAVEPSEGNYDDTYLDAVAERLGWAETAGVAVVVEMHEDIYGEGFGFDGAPRWTCETDKYAAFVPKDPWFINATDPSVEACIDEFYTIDERRQHFIDAWRHVAQHLASSRAVIGFDILNEPNWGTYPIFSFEQDRLAPLYVDVVQAVREAAPDWVAFVEPSASRNGGIPTNLTEMPFADVVYAPHSYDSGAETGSGFDPTHRQIILDNATALAAEATALHAGLWIGEYGGNAADPGIVPYMTAEYDAAGAVAASTMYWAYDNSDGYSLLDIDGNEKTTLVDTVVRPYPERVAGTPISYAYDAPTQTFTFAYTPDGNPRPTQISIAPRIYPFGYTVDCGGCGYEISTGQLSITSPPSDRPATVTLRPSLPAEPD